MNTLSTPLPSSFVGSNKTASPQSRSARIGFWGVCASLAVVGFFTPNGFVTSVAFAVPAILGLLLWREGEPPVLLFGCNELSVATWLSIVAVVVLAGGIRCGFIGAGKPRRNELEFEASRMDIKK